MIEPNRREREMSADFSASPGPTKSFDQSRWQRRLDVAQRAAPADLVIRGGHVANVFSGELMEADVAVVDGIIAGVGDYSEGASEIHASGLVVAPSFIDGH